MQEIQKLSLDQLGRIDVETFKSVKKIPLVVVLDNVRSMHNVGAVFRTSDAFLVQEIILCGITPQPPHREIHKAALGATESVAWRYVEQTTEAVTSLRDLGYQIVAVEQTNCSFSLQELSINSSQTYAIVLGNEVDGVGDAVLPLCHQIVEIPQYGTKHSLNVSVCAGIVIWEFFRINI